MLSPALRKCLTLVAVLVALVAFDRAIAPRDAKRADLAGLRHQARTLHTKPKADVVVLGSSTIGQWLTPRELSKILKVPQSTILDAHLSACFPSCSYSVIESLKAQGRKFRKAFLGVNQFSMCEGGPALRVMQNVELTPVAKLPAVLTNYFYAQHPATYLGTAAAMLASHAYRDTTYQQDRLAISILGRSRNPELWRRMAEPEKLSKEPAPKWRCDHRPEQVALQTRFLEAQLAPLSAISDEVYVLALPQRSLADAAKDPKLSAVWAKHHKRLEAIAARYRNVKLLDMTSGGIAQARLFRDPLHLNFAGMNHQSKRLGQLLRKRTGEAQ